MQKNSSSKGNHRFSFWITIIMAFLLVAVLVFGFVVIHSLRTGRIQIVTEQAQKPPATTKRDITVALQQNLRNLQKGVSPSPILTSDASPNKKIALTLDGLTDDQTMFDILTLLENYDMQVVFYLAGMQVAEAPEVINAIHAAGHEIGSYSLNARDHMENLSQEALLEDFTGANVIFAEVLGKAPALLKCNRTEYTLPLREAASACGIGQVVQSSHYLTYHSFRSYEETLAYVNRLPYRSIVSVKLSGELDASEYSPKEPAATPAIDKLPSTSSDVSSIKMSASQRLLRMLDWLLKAIENANFDPETEILRQRNGGALANVIHGLRTSAPSVGYAFYGLGRLNELVSVLDALDAVSGVGTFLVSAEEIEAYPDQIALIREKNHSIGLIYYPQKDADYYTISFDLIKTKRLLESTGYFGARLVMQPWGENSDALREAAAALSCSLLQPDISFAREKNQNARTAQQAIDLLFQTNPNGFQRGSILGFRMNYFERSGLLAEAIHALQGTRNAYAIQDAFFLAHDADHLYTYPLPEDQILPEVLDRIHPGQLQENVMDQIQQSYLGNRDVRSAAQLPGFHHSEISRLDKRGTIPNKNNVAFLTFDDWGSDVPITKLLDVLRKHQVKATFFVRTEYVPHNPNLLRAIAMEGHEIATHTHTHMPLANDPKNNWRFEEISQEEARALQEDIITSYQVLQSIVGDIRLENGQPALSTLFRPPTLAVSKAGMEAVLDAGITYIVNGSYTSQDYKAKNASRLARSLENYIRSGSIIIMHMSDNSIYTAEALDLYLTGLKQQKDRKVPYTFARLSDYLISNNP